MYATSAAYAIRVFVSSTFIDMQAERDLLINQVFPDIRRRCASLGIDFEAIDLRWGVAGENSDAQVLAYCLDQIDHCLPYLFALIGGRYGWVPGEQADLAATLDETERACSVTEIEILRFQRSVARANRTPRMLVALRDPALTHALGVDEMLVPQAGARLAALRERLATTPDAFHYADLATLVEQVTRYFLAEVQTIAAEVNTPACQIDSHQMRYLSLLRVPGVPHLGVSVTTSAPQTDGSPLSESDLVSILDAQRLHIVQGGPGSGKTTLCAELARRWTERDPLRRALRLHIGATGELSLNGVLRDLYNLADAGEAQDWTGGLVAALRKSVQPTLIVFDGVERIAGWDQALPATLELIAHEPYQLLLTIEALLRAHPDVHVLLTCDTSAGPNNALAALLAEPEQLLQMDPYGGPPMPFGVTRLCPLNADKRRAFAIAFFAFRGKQLTTDQVERIAHASHIEDFDTLHLACDRLRRFGELQRDRQQQDAFVAQHIDMLFGQAQPQAIATVVREARSALGLTAAKVNAVLALLVVSRYGLPAPHVVAMASTLCGGDVTLRDWAVIEGMLGPFLVRGATRFQFKNNAVLDVVSAQLEQATVQQARALLVDYVLADIECGGLPGAFASTVDAVSPSELVWQLSALPGHDGWRRLFDPLTLVAWFARDPEVALIEFNAKFDKDAFQQAYDKQASDVDEGDVITRFRRAAADFMVQAGDADADADADAVGFARALDWTANALFLPEMQSQGQALFAVRVATCALYAAKQDAWANLENCAAAIERTAIVLETIKSQRGAQVARRSPLREHIAAWRATARSDGTLLDERALERIDFSLDNLARQLG